MSCGRPKRRSVSLVAAFVAMGALVGSGAPASAQQAGDKPIPGAKLVHLDRFVPSGVEQKVIFLTAVTPDCVPTGTFTPRVITPPQHGILSFGDAEDYSVWNAPNVREKCNDTKVKGLRIGYKSDPTYTGPDQATILVITADSLAFQYEISIDVR